MVWRWRLTYNQEDEVTQIQGLGSTNTFVYDGDGRRVSRTDSSGTTSFVYDGSSVIAEIGASVTTYRFPSVGEFNSVSRQSDKMADQLGSTMAEVSGAATFLGQYNDDGYGIESDLNGRPSHQSAFRFAGKHGCFTEEDSHMVLCGARYYIPILGRSLTQDPIGHEGGLNLYGYCGGNPLESVDPSGKVIIKVISYEVFGGGWHRGIVVEDNVGSHVPVSFAGGPSRLLDAVLVSKSGLWQGKTQDFSEYYKPTEDYQRVITLVNDQSSFANWTGRFRAIESYIASQPQRYYSILPSDTLSGWSASANSNTWARYLLQQVGLLPQYDHAVEKLPGHDLPWAPGWNIRYPFSR